MQDRIEKEFQEVLRRNDELREQKCTDIFKKLNQEVVRGIECGTYFVSGGYATYQHDFASVVKEYLSQSGGGAKVSSLVFIISSGLHTVVNSASIHSLPTAY